MYEKFLEIKKDKPWLFWLLIIPFAFAAIFEFYNTYLINSGKKAVKDAEEKDKDLKETQDKAQAVADEHKKQADKIEQDIQATEVDEDWHKK